MTYNDLTFLVKEKKITMSQLASDVGFSRGGFKDSIEKKTIPWKSIESLCQLMEITPNKFFGWEEEDAMVGSGNYASHISGGNTQNSNQAIKALTDQLKLKDKEIDRLLKIIEKNSLNKISI